MALVCHKVKDRGVTPNWEQNVAVLSWLWPGDDAWGHIVCEERGGWGDALGLHVAPSLVHGELQMSHIK